MPSSIHPPQFTTGATPVGGAVATLHETLYPRMAALLKQAEAHAARHPKMTVDPRTEQLAGRLMLLARRLGHRRVERPALPAPSPAPLPVPAPPPPPLPVLSWAGLAAELGQAMAALDAFEAAHCVWDRRLGGYAWALPEGGRRSVARLRPPVAPDGVDQEQSDRRKQEFTRMFMLRIQEAREEGFRIGLDEAGKPDPVLPPWPREHGQ
jgi:hypothetical protein